MVSRRTQLFGSLCAMVFMVNFGRLVFAPLVEPLRADFAISAGFVGLVVTLTWIGSAAPRLPTGYLLTKVPRHWVILTAGGILTGAAVVTSLAPTPELLAVSALLMGIASGAYFIAANPLVSELFPTSVGRAIGVHGTASQLAAVAAPLVVSAVLLVSDWRTVFELIAVAAGLVTVLLVVAARRTDLPDAGSEDTDFLGAARAQWPLIVTGVAFIGTTGFVWNGVFNFYVTYLVEVKELSEPLSRNVLTVVFAAGVPAFLITGRLADRFPNVPLILTILGAFAATLFVLTFTTTLIGVVAVSILLGYVIHSLFPALDTYLLDSLPDENRASAYAVYSGTMMLVQATGSVSVGTLTDAGLAFDDVFRGFAVGMAAVLVVLYATHRLGWLPTNDPT